MTGPTIFIAGTVIGALTVGIPLIIALLNARDEIDIITTSKDIATVNCITERTARLRAESTLAMVGPILIDALVSHDFPSDKDQRHDG